MEHKRPISAVLNDLGGYLINFPWTISLFLKGHGPCFRIFSHLTLSEKIFLYRMTLTLRSNSVIVEIGSYLGASTTFLAAGAKDTQSLVYCVDTWKNDAMSEGPRDTFDEFLSNTEIYRDHIKPFRGLSVDIANGFDNPIDLLFLDGDHSYQGCRSDVEAWLPKMKPGGIVVLHDYGWFEGVQQVVREIVKPIEENPGRELPNMYCARIKRPR